MIYESYNSLKRFKNKELPIKNVSIYDCGDSEVEFATCRVIKDKEAHFNFYSITDFHYCREVFIHDNIKGRLSGGKLKKTDAVIVLRNENVNKLYSKIRIINYYEKIAGWKESFVIRTNNPDYRVIVGPHQWMSNNVMISLYLLLLRVLTKRSLKKGETAKKFIERMAKEGNYSYEEDDKLHLKLALEIHPDIIEILMKHYRVITNGIDFSRAKTGYVGHTGFASILFEVKTLEKCIEHLGPRKGRNVFKKYEGTDLYEHNASLYWELEEMRDEYEDINTTDEGAEEAVYSTYNLLQRYKGKRCRPGQRKS